MDWGEYALAFAAFFLTHSLPIRPPLRPWAVARSGPAGFGLAGSAPSPGVLTSLITAAGRAAYVSLRDWAPWQNHVVLVGMRPVCLFRTLAIARPNPFPFGGACIDTFDPRHPGIIRRTRKPLLLAPAHVVRLGTFAGFAILGGRLADRRRRREMGQRWHDLRGHRRMPSYLIPDRRNHGALVWRPAALCGTDLAAPPCSSGLTL